MIRHFHRKLLALTGGSGNHAPRARQTVYGSAGGRALSHAWRDLTNSERRLIELLLTKDFPGADALRRQLETARVSVIDAEGSLQFRVSGPPANVQRRVPTEGYYFDTEGVDYRPAVNVLLHVVEGKLHELEVYKDDGSPIETSLDAVDISRFHLP
ncbi:DUF6984 family protein [Rhizobium laguerreae]|uniref:DUF6984 family protein n=1 Tax=Rhizobium TaxID=379 RepID=UPI003917C87F